MKRLMLAMIRFYRRNLSRRKKHPTCRFFYRRNLSRRKKHPTCRYIPTCSEYAVTAIERYGALKGGRMAAWRVLRCNPFSKGGYDPVPEDPAIILRRE